MRLSILLPTHERPETLGPAIESVVRQEFTDWELLVCGDGCGGATGQLMAAAVERDPRIRWFPLSKGPGFGYANRNRVLAEARGELIGFAAHDNLVFPDHWRRLVAAFEDPEVMLASSSAAWVDDLGRIVPTIFNLADTAVRQRFVAQTDNRMPANAFVYRAALHESVGLWDDSLERAADQDLWSRIIRHCGDRAFCYLPVISFLHFRANWKTAAGIGDPHDGGIWQELFNTAGRLPDILNDPVPPGALPQAVFYERLHGPDGAEWAAAVREACYLAVEAYAGETEQYAQRVTREIEPLKARNPRGKGLRWLWGK